MHHGDDSYTSDGVSKKHRDRAGIGEGTADTKEKTSTNRSTEGNELDVTRLQARIWSIGVT